MYFYKFYNSTPQSVSLMLNSETVKREKPFREHCTCRVFSPAWLLEWYAIDRTHVHIRLRLFLCSYTMSAMNAHTNITQFFI